MYYGIGSLLVLLCLTMIYHRIFRTGKRRARNVVMMALLTAITVVGNLLSFSVVPLQMGTAMVIITGVALGSEAGFMVGSVGRLICNFFQGQGPWTPWEMFSWGLLGCLAGCVFHKAARNMPKAITNYMAVFTFAAVFFIYGGIMNMAALLMSTGYGQTKEISLERIYLIYAAGIPYDLWHALRASVAVFLLGPSMLKRLERIKIKYGFYR